ncbi:hypothetical protein [Streptomyces buecherae]|uniref:hypothetical protein n=1 Tax=Streptomyces buecherae TaxID=2763006 RepID=UPI001C276EB2|nr:hypothetical protein [Streptomyces buecherae]
MSHTPTPPTTAVAALPALTPSEGVPHTLKHLVFEGTHRVIVKGVALRFFLRADGVWAPATDTDFQRAYELALFDPDALRKDVLCPNARRVEHTTVEGWFWSNGCNSAGLCTFDDRSPEECAGMAQVARGTATR